MAAPEGNKNAVGNAGGGRNTSYKHEYAEMARKIARLGATDEELAGIFGVTEGTITNWKKRHVEFSDALKDGKAIADAEVAHSLYQRAIGYRCSEEKVFCSNGEVTVVPMTKHYPPDPTSMIFWLKNRRRDLWNDRKELTGAEGKDLIPKPLDNMTLARKTLFAMAKLLKETEKEDAADGRGSPEK